MTNLSELLARVKAATGPDRELLDAIWLATIPGAQRTNLMAEWPDEAPLWEYFDPMRNTRSRFIQDFMGSVDAALALTERVFPGCCVYPDITPGNHACGLRYGPSHKDTSFSGGATPALAIIAATLSALIAQAKP